MQILAAYAIITSLDYYLNSRIIQNRLFPNANERPFRVFESFSKQLIAVPQYNETEESIR